MASRIPASTVQSEPRVGLSIKIEAVGKFFESQRYRVHQPPGSGRISNAPSSKTALDERGHERFHARQIFQWIYRRGVTDVGAMTDLSRGLRASLAR